MYIRLIVASLIFFILIGCEDRIKDGNPTSINIEYLSHQDIEGFLKKTKTRLPKYVEYFKEASKSSDISWKLLAAISYKESHWNNNAISPTGVRGIMMLTLSTAESLGVNRLNPKASIEAAARYLENIDSKLPDIKDKELKQKLILISYNAGPSIVRRILNSTKKKYGDYNKEIIHEILIHRGLKHSIDYSNQIMEYYRLLKLAKF